MTAPVDELAARRKPAWNPKLQHHSWFDVTPEKACPRCGHEGVEHCCTFCGFQYHSAQESGVWVKHWTVGDRRGRVREMPKCPGPPGETASAPALLTVVASPAEVSTPPSAAAPRRAFRRVARPACTSVASCASSSPIFSALPAQLTGAMSHDFSRGFCTTDRARARR